MGLGHSKLRAAAGGMGVVREAATGKWQGQKYGATGEELWVWLLGGPDLNLAVVASGAWEISCGCKLLGPTPNVRD